MTTPEVVLGDQVNQPVERFVEVAHHVGQKTLRWVWEHTFATPHVAGADQPIAEWQDNKHNDLMPVFKERVH